MYLVELKRYSVEQFWWWQKCLLAFPSINFTCFIHNSPASVSPKFTFWRQEQYKTSCFLWLICSITFLTLFKPAQPHYHSLQQARSIHLVASITHAVSLQHLFSVPPNILPGLFIWHFVNPEKDFLFGLQKIYLKSQSQKLEMKNEKHIHPTFLFFWEV